MAVSLAGPKQTLTNEGIRVPPHSRDRDCKKRVRLILCRRLLKLPVANLLVVLVRPLVESVYSQTVVFYPPIVFYLLAALSSVGLGLTFLVEKSYFHNKIYGFTNSTDDGSALGDPRKSKTVSYGSIFPERSSTEARDLIGDDHDVPVSEHRGSVNVETLLEGAKKH